MSYDIGFSSGADYGREDERERCVSLLRARADRFEQAADRKKVGSVASLFEQVASELRRVANELERGS